MKLMEIFKVNYDYSVNAAGSIIQFIYGDDGMDATFVRSQPLEIIKLSTENIIKNYYFDENTNWSMILNKELLKDVKIIKKYMLKVYLQSLNTKICL